MNNHDFNDLVSDQFDLCRTVLIAKEEEYSLLTDRLHNFRMAASLNGQPMREALGGMMVKHTISLYDMIFDLKDHPIAMWEEKITDHINYLVLLMAVITEDEIKTNPEMQGAATFMANVPTVNNSGENNA